MSQTGGYMYAAADDGPSINAGPAENAGPKAAQHDPVKGARCFNSPQSAAADGRLQMAPYTSFTVWILIQKPGLRQLLRPTVRLTVISCRIRIRGALKGAAVFGCIMDCSLLPLPSHVPLLSTQ